MSQSVSQQSQQWMVKDLEGKLSGPHSMKEMIHFIHIGKFIGAEKISKYPGGLWKTLSKCPEFYDPLFFALANKNLPQTIEDSSHSSDNHLNDQEKSVDNENDQSVHKSISKNVSEHPIIEDAGIGPFYEDKQILTENEEKKEEEEKENIVFEDKGIFHEDRASDFKDESFFDEKASRSENVSNFASKNTSFVHHSPSSIPKNSSSLLPQKLEQNKINLPVVAEASKKKKKKKKSRRMFKMLFFFFFIMVSYLLLEEDINDQDEQFISLKAPQKFNIGKLSQSEIRERFRKAVKLFHKSTYIDYIKAQDELIALAEEASDIPDILGLLCLTHRELWPYSQKTTQDREAVSLLSQRISTVQAIGIHQAQCNIVKYLFSNQLAMALDITNKVLEDYQDVPVLYDLKAEILAKEKKYTEAVAFIQRARDIASVEWKSWLNLYIRESEYQMADQKFIDAANILQPLHSKFPSHTVISVLLGYLNLKFLDNREKGAKLIRQGLQSGKMLQPKIYAEVTLALAEYYESQQKKKMALDFAKKSYQENPDQNVKETILRLGGLQALQSMKTTSDQLVAAGDIFYEKKRYMEAQSQYNSAFEEDPKNAIAALKVAKCLWKLNLSKESTAWAKKAIQADPQLVEAYITLSDYLSQKYLFDAAVFELLRAMKKLPRNYKILKSIALVEFKRQNYVSAESFTRKALKLNDADIDINNLLAEILYETKQYNEAFHMIARSVEMSGYNVQAHKLYAKIITAIRGEAFGVKHLTNLINTYPNTTDYQVALAEIYLINQRYLEARDVLEKVIENDPSKKEAYMLLGDAYLRIEDDKGALNKALGAYSNAALIDPFDVKPLFEVGLIYLRTQGYAEAIRWFRRVVNVNENYPKAHFYQGTAYFHLGRSNRALAAAKKEKQINPSLAEPYLLAGDILYEGWTL